MGGTPYTTLTPSCDACGRSLPGGAAGSGLLVFPRGDDVSLEEPPLCERCAHAIGVSAIWQVRGGE